MSIPKAVWAWLVKAWHSIRVSADSVAIAVTEEVKGSLDSGVVGFIANAIDQLTKSKIADSIVADLKVYIPKVLATELAVQGLPDNPTQAQILTFENAILSAFNLHDNKSKLYTTLAAQIYGRISYAVSSTPGKFSDWVTVVEDCYQDYLGDLPTLDDGEK